MNIRATLTCSFLLSAFLFSSSADALVIEKVVVVQRHGVRSPTKSAESLSRFSKEPWHEWPVKPGILTPHGADGAQAMGAYLRKTYLSAGVLPSRGCGGAFVWADGDDQRTRVSGDALASGISPGCGLKARFKSDGADPLFSPDDAGLCRVDAVAARASILSLIPSHDLNRLGPEYERARQAMAGVLYPGLDRKACIEDAHDACIFVNGRNAVAGEGWHVKLEGPLGTGSSLSENLLLEYAQGFPRQSVGWGRAGSAKAIASVMPLHNLYADLTRRNPYFAARKGAPLAREIADVLGATSPSFAHGVKPPADAKFVGFLGHDSNLSNLAGVFGLNWTLPGQPDNTAPNTALAFELVRDGDGRFVRVSLFYQTLEELRRPGAAARGHMKRLQLPDCHSGPGGTCPLPRFTEYVARHVDKSCFE